MEISKATRYAELKPERHFAITEPPGVPRGISTNDPGGDVVELYIKRDEVPFSRNGDWRIEQFQDMIVIGVAREHDEKWTVVGQVMLIREMDATRLPTRSSEQPGTGQPVTKHADKVRSKVQSPTPTSKDDPRYPEENEEAVVPPNGP